MHLDHILVDLLGIPVDEVNLPGVAVPPERLLLAAVHASHAPGFWLKERAEVESEIMRSGDERPGVWLQSELRRAGSGSVSAEALLGVIPIQWMPAGSCQRWLPQTVKKIQQLYVQQQLTYYIKYRYTYTHIRAKVLFILLYKCDNSHWDFK